MNRTWVTVGVIVIGIVVIGTVWFFATEEKEEAQDERLSQNAIFLTDQLPGYEVEIKIVYLEAPGYVVIHSIGEDGVIGDINGNSRLLEAGESRGIDVELDSRTKEGDMIAAVLYSDNGDKLFDSTDLPLRDFEGAVIQSVVLVTEDADTDIDVQF